jgi:voltage-gated potassium channel
MAVIRRLRVALLLLLLVLLCGAVGYMRIEGWSFFDALYMTVNTVTFVGFGEVHPLSPAGRAFTMCLLASAAAVSVYTAAVLTQLVVLEPLREVLGKRRMERGLARLSGHTIVCGWGRMGQEIADQLRRRSTPLVVVELSEPKCRLLEEAGILCIHGDASDDQVLRAAGVERARALIAVAPKDADNIFITLSARALNRELVIVARSIYEQDVHKLRLAGANRVISPYVIGARRIATAVFNPSVVDFLDLESQEHEEEWGLEQVGVHADAAFAGQTLRQSGIREHTGCTVVALRDAATGRLHSNPGPDTRIDAGDLLVVLGGAAELARLRELAAGKRR